MITIREQIECVEREIGLRKRVYPKWIEANKMSQDKAQKEIQAMEAVKASLLLMPKESSLIRL